MNNIWLVAAREYLTRVKKKSFIVMTLLGPVLIAALYGGLIWLAITNSTNKELKLVEVVDYSGVLNSGLESDTFWVFTKGDTSVLPDSQQLDESLYGKLIIPPSFTLDKPEGARLITSKTTSLGNQEVIEARLRDAVKNMKLARAGIRREQLDSLKTDVTVQAVTQTERGIERTNIGVKSALGFACAFAIYLFIFIYGVQVMRGVMEEKSNRIVEVIVSSVRPFQLMMGKIFGIALVGLTQLFIWLILSSVLMGTISVLAGPDLVKQSQEQTAPLGSQPQQADKVVSLIGDLASQDLPLIVGSFIFYFLGGYLFYSALFAAIAAAVDNETDTQQFMLPVTIPLIFALVVAMTTVINNPHGAIATWFSMIPFTSPIVMMVRIPFGVNGWELFFSIILMILGFLATTWIASRIYRVGILMYGKKADYKELWKWIRYRG